MAIQVSWAIQNNLGNSKDIAMLEQACAAQNVPYYLVQAIPFSDVLPDVPDDKPVIFYGSSHFTTTVFRSGRWRPGVFFDEQAFLYSTAMRHYGLKLLNATARTMTMQELAADTALDDQQILFIRPDGDLKEFAGGVQMVAAFREWCELLKPGGFVIDLNTPIIVAEPRDIEYEWRVFMVNGRAVAGSHYRTFGELDVHEGLPVTVSIFAEQMAEIWSPSPVFVLDIAQCDGELFVLETNGFNSSGFYASHISTIVQEVTRFVVGNAG